MMAIDVEGVRQSEWERNAYLGCAALITYEYFLQLDSEVEYFWEKRWSLAKALFLWSRYYGLLFNISNAVVYMQRHPPIQLCETFFQWQNTGASLQVITIHLILQLRVWAMYGNSRRMLVFLIFLILTEALILGIIFGTPRNELIATNNPLPGVSICADADPAGGRRWIVYYWLTILIVDTVLLSLALRKALEHRYSTRNKLMREMTTQSVIYFVAIFWIYIANMVLWIRNRITLDELGTAFSLTIPSMLANRLLINCRRAHQPEDTLTSVVSTFWRKKKRWRETSGNVELTTCNDLELGGS